MRTKTIILTFFPCLLLLPLPANAFYNSQPGRWLSRDPITESGGAALYAFVHNDAPQEIDLHGLFGCASKRPTCVCNEVVITNKAVPTGAVKMTWHEAGGPNYHVWLTWDLYSVDSNAGSWGNYNPMIGWRPAAGATLPIYQTPTPKAEAVELSPCEYDFVKFRACLTASTEKYKGGLYTGKFCDPFVKDLIDACKEESKGCTPSW